MTGAERGFLLLTSHLGDPNRKPLTVAQLRSLYRGIGAHTPNREERDLMPQDIMDAGFSQAFALRVTALLSAEDQLDWYLNRAQRQGCTPISMNAKAYPGNVRKCLGQESPGCLWGKGDLSFLQLPGISLVGSRELSLLNEAFAWEAGCQAAKQGYVLISGNARGADSAAQQGALDNGGKVISVVADRLEDHPADPNILYLSELDFDAHFSAMRALSRNRVIHSLGSLVLVAQCNYGKGGTWDGTVQNLKNRWTPVYCLDDGSRGAAALEQMGAQLISGRDLCDLNGLKQDIPSMFN